MDAGQACSRVPRKWHESRLAGVLKSNPIRPLCFPSGPVRGKPAAYSDKAQQTCLGEWKHVACYFPRTTVPSIPPILSLDKWGLQVNATIIIQFSHCGNPERELFLSMDHFWIGFVLRKTSCQTNC